MRKPKKQKKPLNDLSRSLTPFDPNHSLIAVIELAPIEDIGGLMVPIQLALTALSRRAHSDSALGVFTN
jgi:hypothetical protein